MDTLTTQTRSPQTTQADNSLQEDIERLDTLSARMSWTANRLRVAELERYNLTLPQFVALRAINQCEDGCCNMSELAETVQQVPATMTGIVDRLVQRGLAARSPNPSDRRAFRISLTDEGVKLVNKINNQKKTRLASFAATLSPEDRHKMITLIGGMLDHLYPAAKCEDEDAIDGSTK